MAKQEIIAPVVRLVSRAIESVSFQNAYLDGPDKPRGSINVTNDYEGAVEQPDDSVAYQLVMTLTVTPEEESSYYALEVTASALFVPSDEDLDEEEIQYAVLSAGAQSLYGYIVGLAGILTRDGALGELSFPVLMFDAFDEESEQEFESDDESDNRSDENSEADEAADKQDHTGDEPAPSVEA